MNPNVRIQSSLKRKPRCAEYTLREASRIHNSDRKRLGISATGHRRKRRLLNCERTLCFPAFVACGRVRRSCCACNTYRAACSAFAALPRLSRLSSLPRVLRLLRLLRVLRAWGTLPLIAFGGAIVQPSLHALTALEDFIKLASLESPLNVWTSASKHKLLKTHCFRNTYNMFCLK